MKYYYDVPEQYRGMNLSQLQQQSGLPFRADVLGSFIGRDQNSPIGESLAVDLPDSYRSSGESQALESLFGRGLSQEQYDMRETESAQQRFLNERTAAVEASRAPIISQLESEKDPLKSRYTQLINQIRGREERSIGESDIALAQEYGRRGMLPSSSNVTDVQNRSRQRIREDFADEELNAQGQLEDRLSTIGRDIANLRASITPEAFQQAMQLIGNRFQQAGLSENRRQFDTSSSQNQDQFNRSLGLQQDQFNFQREQANRPQTTIQTIGGRVRLINSETGQTIADLGASGSGSGSSNNQAVYQQVLDGASQGRTFNDLQRQFGASVGVDQVRKLYDAASIYGPHRTGEEPVDYAEQFKQEEARRSLDALNNPAPQNSWWSTALTILGGN